MWPTGRTISYPVFTGIPGTPENHTRGGMTVTSKDEVARNLVKAREAVGLTQARAADMLQVPRSTMSQVESGKLYPSPTLLMAAAEHLGVSADTLLGTKIAKSEYDACVRQAMLQGYAAGIGEAVEERVSMEIALAREDAAYMSHLDPGGKARVLDRATKLAEEMSAQVENSLRGIEMSVSERMAVVAQRLDELMMQEGVSNSLVAAHLGTTPSAINAYRRHGALPTLQRLVALADFFGVSPNWLLGWDEPEQLTQKDRDKINERASRLATAIAVRVERELATGASLSEYGPRISSTDKLIDTRVEELKRKRELKRKT